MNVAHNVVFTRMAAEMWLENSWIFGCKYVYCDGKNGLGDSAWKVFLELLS